MKLERSAVQLLVLLEIIVLIVAIIFGVMQKGKTAAQTNKTQTPVAADAVDQAEQEEPDVESAFRPDTYELTPVTFSAEVQDKLAAMTVEEKVAQMFLVTPDALTHADGVTIAGNGTADAINQYPVGGLVYSTGNFQSRDQIQRMLSGVQSFSYERIGLPMLLAVEELGGSEYSPLATAVDYSVQNVPVVLAAEEDPAVASEAARTIAEYLASEGFNLNLAPVADLAAGIDSAYDSRTYGENSSVASAMIAESISAYHETGILTAAGAFPGKAAGSSNTKDWNEWQDSDLLAYRSAVSAGSDCMILGNVTYEALTGDDTTPCSLSAGAVYYLRSEMNYTGIIMTDSLSEDRITANYSSGEAAVAAVKAGVDLICCPADFEEAYQAVLDAVGAGEISVDTIDQAVGYILTEKLSIMESVQE